ncbi:hypothetical protein MRX96_033601 [Rhipicephalus microplus]
MCAPASRDTRVKRNGLTLDQSIPAAEPARFSTKHRRRHAVSTSLEAENPGRDQEVPWCAVAWALLRSDKKVGTAALADVTDTGGKAYWVRDAESSSVGS